jgi:hypothetical protein
VRTSALKHIFFSLINVRAFTSALQGCEFILVLRCVSVYMAEQKRSSDHL